MMLRLLDGPNGHELANVLLAPAGNIGVSQCYDVSTPQVMPPGAMWAELQDSDGVTMGEGPVMANALLELIDARVAHGLGMLADHLAEHSAD